jgi:hypothetical protein
MPFALIIQQPTWGALMHPEQLNKVLQLQIG